MPSTKPMRLSYSAVLTCCFLLSCSFSNSTAECLRHSDCGKSARCENGVCIKDKKPTCADCDSENTEQSTSPDTSGSDGGITIEEDTDTSDFDTETTAESTDSEGSTDTSSETEQDTVEVAKQTQCHGECILQTYSKCTCDPSDPCGWVNDRFCDAGCLTERTVEAMFDDSEDCGACPNRACEEQVLNDCTCSPYDPCGWAGDGKCQSKCLYDLNGLPVEMFDDSEDCGVCSGACDEPLYTRCSCGVDDPCDWANDPYCDIGCLSYEVVEEMFYDPLCEQ